MKPLLPVSHIKGRSSILLLFFVLLHTMLFAQLKADFSASVTSGCTPLVVQFTDKSTGGPADWTWNLGTSTSVKQNPSAIFINPGTYTIKLKIKNANGEDSITKTNYITVHAKPVVDFNASPSAGCIPLPVSFTDLSTTNGGTITSRVWDFGDGTSSPDQNPTHTYTLTDTFNITLIVTNSFGCVQSLLKSSYIAVADTVNADFSYTYSNICNPPATFTFSNLSKSSSSLSYQWFFGDGDQSASINPSHEYILPGDYEIKLAAFNNAGCADTIVKSIHIGTQAANFTLPSVGCANEPIVMQDSSLTQALSGSWDFGDGATATGLVVSHIYKTPGTYTVNYSTDFGGCKSSIKKTIVIASRPTASFNSPSVVVACSAPLTVSFVNTSTGAVSYIWEFGDGAVSTDISPVHQYSTQGNFTVTLIAVNSAGGCNDTVTKTNFVKINFPVINGFQGLPYAGCAPETIYFNPDISVLDQVATYKWFFGDGDSSALATPSHTYPAGEYTVKLIITTTGGCIDTFELAPAVALSNRPIPNFTATPRYGCASAEIQFTDSSTKGVTQWEWNFGDGTKAFDQNPVHRFRDTGSFDIFLKVSTNGCSDSVLVRNYIYIRPPVAAFIPSIDCNNRYLKTFTDKSIAPKTWNWDFGDGNTANIQSPSHTYAAKGQYTVELIVTNGTCEDTLRSLVFVIDENPQIDITSVPRNFCKYDSVKFTATNYDPNVISSFKWNYGDGTGTFFSLRNEVMHRYQQAGNYTPFLITADLNDCRDTVGTITPFNIYGPTAFFSNTEGTCKNSLFVFSDSSVTDGIHSLTKWLWNYGDAVSETFTAAPFQHQYLSAGTYDVKIIVYDSNGCTDTLLKPQNVIITDPIAAFTVLDSIHCASSKVHFADNSSGLDLKYKWDFGDGNTSIEQSPLHTYPQEAVYSVSLSLTDRFGCTDTVSKPNLVTVSNPVASFSISDSSATCPPLPVQVTNTSKSYTSVSWDFGDGNTSTLAQPFHYYTTPGKYNLVLVAHGYGDCYDTATRSINLKGPNGTFNYNPLKECYPLEASFLANTENTAFYTWDFGDGSTKTTTDDSIKYKYRAPGAFVPKLIMEDRSGCRVALENKDTIRVLGVYPYFLADVATGCDSSLAIFTDSSIVTSFDAVNTRQWDFGDGTQSNEVSPSHYYKKPGKYRISLFMATEAGCSGSDTLVINVSINKAPLLTASIPDSLCVNTPANFTAKNTNNIPDSLSGQWNFGNGDILNIQNTSYTYKAPGIYKASIISTATTGCADTIEKSIQILPPPPVNAGAGTSLCRFKSYTLQPSGAAVYVWANAASLSCLNCINPVAMPDSTSTYYVTGTDNFGCAATDSVTITVIQTVLISLAANGDTLCKGSSVKLNVSGASFYSWSPAGGLSSTTIANPIASPSASTVYTVIGTSDINACFADTAQVSILVAPIPTFNIIDSFVTINVGSSYQFKTSGSADVMQWLWLPPFGLSCSNCAQPLAQPKSNITYTATASTIFGCTATDNIRIEVVCNNANIFIPNTFSPNADGSNDYFYPRGTGLFNIKSMRIFNRWGVLVFSKTNFAPESEKQGWDGKYYGNPQQPDVYVYVIDVLCENGTVLSYKGNVTLIR